MDASAWISFAALGATLVGAAIAFGVIKQTVAGLKEVTAKLDQRVTTCEAGHQNTAQEMNQLRVDVAVLKERSGTTILTLERIERLVTPENRPTPRARTAK